MELIDIKRKLPNGGFFYTKWIFRNFKFKNKKVISDIKNPLDHEGGNCK